METDNKPNAITLRVVKEEYNFDGKTTTCTIKVKTNIKEFERKYFAFTPAFIRHTIGAYLPTVETVTNYKEIISPAICAKFYHMPGGKTKVLNFHKDYYQAFHDYSEDQFLSVGDVVSKRSLPGVNAKIGEYKSIDYCDTFTIKVSTTCAEEDTYDKDTGMSIALTKAMEKGAARIGKLLAALLAYIRDCRVATMGMMLELSVLHTNIIGTHDKFTEITAPNC